LYGVHFIWMFSYTEQIKLVNKSKLLWCVISW